MNKAIVVSIENEVISVKNLEKSECLTCTAGCTKNAPVYKASNPKNLQVKAGSVVILDASKKAQALQGIFSLLFPFLSAVTGYFLASPIARLFNSTVSDGFRSVCVLLFLTLSSSIVFALTRKIKLPGKPVIVQVES